MNLIINLVKLKEDTLENYKLEIGNDSILSKVITQVSTSSISNISIIIDSRYCIKLKAILKKSNCLESVNIISLEKKIDFELANSLLLSDVTQAYKTFKTQDLSLLMPSVDLNVNTILLDGRYLYKRNNFNFSECSSDVYVKFKDYQTKQEICYMMFFKQNVASNDDIKKILVEDYDQNFIDITKLKSILNSSESFSQNKSLRLLYIKELLSKFEFEQALENVKHFALNDPYWTITYIEYLQGMGKVQELSEFYNTNKLYIKKLNISETQKKQFASSLQCMNLIEMGEVLVSNEVDEFSVKLNVDIEFVIRLIKSSKLKQVGVSYLISSLIETGNLNEKYTTEIIKLIDSIDTNPYFRMYNLVKIFNYFCDEKKVEPKKIYFINHLFLKLHENEELFASGLKSYAIRLEKILQLIPLGNVEETLIENKIQPSKPRIAVTISGLALFNFEKNLELIKYYFTNGFDVDYFVQSWNVCTEYPGLGSLDSDFSWAEYYLGRVKNLQPKFIERQANFEALLPKTSELLFKAKYTEVSKNQYKNILGEDLRKIVKYDINQFNSKLQSLNVESKEMKNNFRRYFELNVLRDVITNYVIETGQKYDYVINIDINTMLKTSVDITQLQNIETNQLLVLTTDEKTIGNSFLASEYETFMTLSKIWKLSITGRSMIPYTSRGKRVYDLRCDPMLIHLIANNVSIRNVGDQLGAPYYSKKIILPKTGEVLNMDLKNYDGDSEQIVKYFTEIDKLFTNPINNNTNYQRINKVTLLDYEITHSGIVIELSITGLELKSLNVNKFHLSGSSIVGIDSELSRSRVYKQGFETLKQEDDEIVLKKEILNKDLLIGRKWEFTLLYHDYTLSNHSIDYLNCENKFELDKNGLKFINFDKTLTLGIDIRDFLLTGKIKD